MKKISLLMVSMLLMGLLVGCSSGDDKKGQAIQSGDYTSEPGGANKGKGGEPEKTEGETK
jgi:major membrane immunogen (membrane-anchored lipoprotein)